MASKKIVGEKEFFVQNTSAGTHLGKDAILVVTAWTILDKFDRLHSPEQIGEIVGVLSSLVTHEINSKNHYSNTKEITFETVFEGNLIMVIARQLQ